MRFLTIDPTSGDFWNAIQGNLNQLTGNMIYLNTDHVLSITTLDETQAKSWLEPFLGRVVVILSNETLVIMDPAVTAESLVLALEDR